MIRLDRVSVTYRTAGGNQNALENVDLGLDRGESCAVIGPTGCGKSTLLFLLAGLLSPTSGRVSVSGVPLTGVRRETSLILQQQGLFPWKSAFRNASLGLAVRGVQREEREALTRALMEKLDIWDVRRSYPAQLSGGQRQRVAIARSLVTEPDLLLMDEPFSALDALTRESLQDLLLHLWREQRFTFVLVTHSIEEAVFMGRRVAVLSSRPGRLVKILDNPRMWEPDFRLSGSFHAMCTEIRRTMEELRS